MSAGRTNRWIAKQGEQMSDLPKGFYKGPDGRERFWDGDAWFEAGENFEGIGSKSTLKEKLNALSHRKRNIVLVSALTAVLLAGGAGTGVAINLANQAQLNAAAQAAEEAAAKEAAADAAAAAAAKEADLERRRANRKSLVKEIEASVKKMASNHADEGFIEGPVSSVGCTTTGGVSIDDISIRSMLFECFASTKENSDGTSTGYYYNARVNWDDASYTYGFGRAE